jgi:hypothetical protein
MIMQEQEWISVDKQMPPIEKKSEMSDPDAVYTHTDDVIALLSDGNIVRTYHDGDVWCYWEFSGCPQYDVTHWIPLPIITKDAEK